MDKLKLHSKDLTAENIEKLAALFPNCLTETKAEDGSIKHAIDFDLLRQELSADLVEGPQERYRLDWPGKREALATANAPIAKTLRPCREESVDFDTTKNLYIEGDNLEALKLLQETYLGKVQVVCIDPPYNTGNDFVYDDDFAESSTNYFARSNQSDEEGNRLVANTDSNGRFHSDWLSMMYSRLKIATNLLSPEGVVFVAIDDGEVANARKIGDEVFGQDNFLASFIWEGGRKNDAKLASNGHDFILCWVKSRTNLVERGVRWRERKAGLDEIYQADLKIRKKCGTNFEDCRKELNTWFKTLSGDHPSLNHKHFSYFDKRGIYFPDNLRSPNPRPNLVFDWKGYKPHPNGWAYSKERMKELDEQDRLHYPSSMDGRVTIKSYLHEHETWAPNTVFYQDRRVASKRLDTMLGKKVFPFPKDENILAKFIHTCASENALVIDFFSGSASTAHAVMKINAEDGGNRRHIMVQLPEACEDKSAAFKAGYTTIAEIGKERIRRAGAKIRAELEAQLEGELPGSDKHQEITAKLANLDTGFRVLKVDSSNMADVYYRPDEVTQDGLALQVENIKPDRSPEDLLFQVLLDWGVDLALPIEQETIAGKTVFFVDGNALAACFDTGLDEDFVKELAKREPLRAVFRDASFANDATRINIEQIFKALSPHTELKSI